MKMGQSIYEQEQANAASDAPEGGDAGAEGGAEEEVVDAEFSEVDEDAKKLIALMRSQSPSVLLCTGGD